MNPRTDARREPRINLAKLQIRFGERDALPLSGISASALSRQLNLPSSGISNGLCERTLPAVHIRVFRAIFTSLRSPGRRLCNLHCCRGARRYTLFRNDPSKKIPMAPFDRTRTPIPIDSDAASVPLLRFL